MEKLFIVATALVCAIVGQNAMAATIVIKNASFEDQALPDGGFINGFGPKDWSGGLASPTGPLNPLSSTFASIPDGENIMFSATGTLGSVYQGVNYQQISESLAANTLYTLLVDVGHALDADMADFVIEFTDGFGEDSTVFASQTLARDSIAAGSFKTVSLTFDSVLERNSPFGIRFRTFYDPAQGNDQRLTFFDNVRLDASPISAGAVPEPATWTMMIGGFGLVGSGMRRRRQAIKLA